MPSAPRPPPKDVALVQATPPRASNGRLGSIAAVPTRPPEVTTALKSVPEEPVATDQVDASLYDSIEQIGNNTAVVTPVLVTVRVRPPTIGELAKRDGTTLCTETLKSQVRLLAANGKGDGKPKEFTFDRVFGVEDGQKKVYDAAVRKLIDKCLNGYNGCIFAYGQTASGKTFTISGPAQATPDQYGVIQRVALQIMDHVTASTKPGEVEFQVKISYLEIYQEKLVDLLAGESEQGELKIRQDADTGLYVQGITEREVVELKDIMTVHAIGSKNRTVGETNMNEASSRSHAIMTITVVEQRMNDKVNKLIKKTSKLHIVDLAGSERAETSGATGARLKEGSAINQSLSTLGNVINSLTSADRSHVPYRDSKLTYLLSDCLGGNSLTLIIACISPVAFNLDESLSTLRFADRAKHIKNHAKINTDPMMLRIMALEAEVFILRQRLSRCRCGAATLDGDVDPGQCSFWRWPFRSKNKVKPAKGNGKGGSDEDVSIDTDPETLMRERALNRRKSTVAPAHGSAPKSITRPPLVGPAPAAIKKKSMVAPTTLATAPISPT